MAHKSLILLLIIPLLLLISLLSFLLSSMHKIPQLKHQRNNPNKLLEINLILLIFRFDLPQPFVQFGLLRCNAHVHQDCFHAQSCYCIVLVYGHAELFLELEELGTGIELVEGDVLCAIDCAVFADFLYGLFEDLGWVY